MKTNWKLNITVHDTKLSFQPGQMHKKKKKKKKKKKNLITVILEKIVQF